MIISYAVILNPQYVPDVHISGGLYYDSIFNMLQTATIKYLRLCKMLIYGICLCLQKKKKKKKEYTQKEYKKLP